MRRSQVARAPGPVPALLFLLALGLTLGCNNNGDTIIINQGLDCGLIRNDLLGDWLVSFTPGSTTLVNCDDGGASDGTPVGVPPGTRTFTNVTVFASASSTSFVVLADGPDRSDELKGNVEADSCLALLQIWEEDDLAWMQCIGEFDVASRTISAVCDSADLDLDMTRGPDVTCDLNTSLSVAVALFF